MDRTEKRGRRAADKNVEAPDNKKAKMSNVTITKKRLGKHTFPFLAKNLYPENLGVFFAHLGLPQSLIQRFKDEERSIPDRILRGLNVWRNKEIGNKTSPNTRMNNLLESLKFIDRRDLADAVDKQGIDETEDVEESEDNLGCEDIGPSADDIGEKTKDDGREELLAKVVKKSKSTLSYTSQSKFNDGKTFSYFNIIVASTNAEGEQKYVTIRSYLNNYQRIQVGKSFHFKNVIRKTDQLWCISKSEVIRIEGLLGTYDKNAVNLPEDEPNIGLKRSLVDALNTFRRSVVVGKIFKISNIKYVPRPNDEQLALRKLALTDEKGTAKVTLFAQNALQNYQRDEIIQITRVFGTNYDGKQQLQAIQGATVSRIQDPRDSLKKLIAYSEDFESDKDFDDEDLETFKIYGICDSEMYDYCANEACKKTKLKSDGCPKCQGRKKGGRTCRVVISLLKPDGTQLPVTLFQNKVKIIFGIENFTTEDELMDRKPKSFQAKLSEDNKLTTIGNIIYASN